MFVTKKKFFFKFIKTFRRNESKTKCNSKIIRRFYIHNFIAKPLNFSLVRSWLKLTLKPFLKKNFFLWNSIKFPLNFSGFWKKLFFETLQKIKKSFFLLNNMLSVTSLLWCVCNLIILYDHFYYYYLRLLLKTGRGERSKKKKNLKFKNAQFQTFELFPTCRENFFAKWNDWRSRECEEAKERKDLILKKKKSRIQNWKKI